MEYLEAKQHAAPWSLDKLKEGISPEDIRKEYDYLTEFSKTPLPSTAATQQENMKKNRWPLFPASDCNRVILLSGEGDDSYINANYLPDHEGNPRGIIATQAPLEETVDDLWRMIWQEKVNLIVMLTDILDHEKKYLCAKYWPETGSKDYGHVTVTMQEVEKHPEFTTRKFSVSCQNEMRELVHVHYRGWPDRGVPGCRASLLRLWQVVHSYKEQTNKPYICHCSAGIGRSGTYLAIVQALTHAREKGHVNLRNYVLEMRKCRPLMVQKFEQYMYVYETLQEALNTPDFLCADIQNIDFGSPSTMTHDPDEDEEPFDVVQEREPSR